MAYLGRGICCGIVVALLWHSLWHHSIISLHPRQISHALPGTQACTFDIKAFHQTYPVLPDHKPFLVVVQFDSLFLTRPLLPIRHPPSEQQRGTNLPRGRRHLECRDGERHRYQGLRGPPFLTSDFPTPTVLSTRSPVAWPCILLPASP
jgi:hypothetical protein